MQTLNGILSLTLVLCIICTLSFMGIFTYRRIAELEAYLSDCKCIIDAREQWGGGIIGRQMRMNMISIVLAFPHRLYKIGYITRNANLNIPRNLRRSIFWQYLIIYSLTASAIVLFIVIKR